ncbi:hypothetical protein P9214_07350 [Heyndrickxia coagulans]|uniref:hypothetical protein n=1 Tax=Heyndrickxia coagulans TaxID=1398 RepID=UPI002E1C9B97|nr:hypothetical protein [Heyndrickxia coagulans]
MKCKKMGNSKDKACLFGNRKGGQEQYALPDIPTKIEGLQSTAASGTITQLQYSFQSKPGIDLSCPVLV